MRAASPMSGSVQSDSSLIPPRAVPPPKNVGGHVSCGRVPISMAKCSSNDNVPAGRLIMCVHSPGPSLQFVRLIFGAKYSPWLWLDTMTSWPCLGLIRASATPPKSRAERPVQLMTTSATNGLWPSIPGPPDRVSGPGKRKASLMCVRVWRWMRAPSARHDD